VPIVDWPFTGAIVHVGPSCVVGIVLLVRVNGGSHDVYLRVLRPKIWVVPGLTWGGIMEVETHDMEGWVSVGDSLGGWHWPEKEAA